MRPPLSRSPIGPGYRYACHKCEAITVLCEHKYENTTCLGCGGDAWFVSIPPAKDHGQVFHSTAPAHPQPNNGCQMQNKAGELIRYMKTVGIDECVTHNGEYEVTVRRRHKTSISPPAG